MDAAAHAGPLAGDIAVLLARGPFAAAAARGAALVVGAGDPPRALYASSGALASFGARDLAGLDAALFGADSPGARRLRQLSRALPVGGAPRLEILRFFAGRAPITVGWLCARIAGTDGADMLVAAAPVRALEEGRARAAAESPTPFPEPEEPPFTPMPVDGPVRFLWNCDGEGRFGPPDGALTARLGSHAPRQGETPDSLRARIAFDPADALGEAISARRTFSGLRLEWPEQRHARARVALLSGATVLDRERGFAGFRGFGVFTGEAISLVGDETALVARAADHAPEAVPEPGNPGGSSAIPIESGLAAAAIPSPTVGREPGDASPGSPVAEVAAPAAEALAAAAPHPVVVPSPVVEAAQPPPIPAAPAANAIEASEANPEPPRPRAAPAAEAATRSETLEAAPAVRPEDGASSGAPIARATEAELAAPPVFADSREPSDLATPGASTRAQAEPPAPAAQTRETFEALVEDLQNGDAPLAAEASADDRAPVAWSAPEPTEAGEAEAPTASTQPPLVAAESALAPEPDEAPTEDFVAVLRALGFEPSDGDPPWRRIDSAGLEPLPEPEPDAAGGGDAEDRSDAVGPAAASEELASALESHYVGDDFDLDNSEVEAATEHAVGPMVPASFAMVDETPAPPPARDAAAEPTVDPPRSAREGGAEIYVLRPPSESRTPAPNVVPIRPGALGVLSPPPTDTVADTATRPRGEGETIELTSQERDAFKEIARALGVRQRGSRDELADAESTAPASGRAAAPASETHAADAGEPPCHEIALLLDLLPIGALVLRAGEAIYLNRTLLDLVGYPSIENFRESGGLDRIFRGRDPATLIGECGDLPLVAAGDELTTVDAHARQITWRGEPAVLIALRRSREVEHQAALRAVERDARAHAATARDLTTALDLAADGLVRLDESGRVLAMNRRAEALLGYDQKEAAGESFLMLLSPGSQAEATAALERATRERGATAPVPGPELVARERGGRLVPVRMDFGRLAGPGAPEYFALLHDLSRLKDVEREREAAREAAEKASARKTDFLARVSHEIRTPLHAILGFAEVMIEERFGPIGSERYRDYIKDIHASGRHVMSLANDLLDLSKIEAGKMEMQFAPVNANKIIRECVALMQPQAARERIIVRLSLLDRLPNVMADERSLRQIMLNLMSNAVKFNEPGGQVIVSTALDEAGHAIIRVRDTGVGMNETELGVALEPFRRVAGGDREGTGLGLPLTKALAEANHAEFSIKSRKEHGTLVEVAFPRARAAQ